MLTAEATRHRRLLQQCENRVSPCGIRLQPDLTASHAFLPRRLLVLVSKLWRPAPAGRNPPEGGSPTRVLKPPEGGYYDNVKSALASPIHVRAEQRHNQTMRGNVDADFVRNPHDRTAQPWKFERAAALDVFEHG
jgi:hypothetical protein